MKKRGMYEPVPLRLRVGKSRTGKGLFTEEAIPKGTCIIEYVGRVISKEEEYTSRSKYLFEVNARKTLDGPPRINRAGYINHSCRPNTEPIIRKGRIFIMAKRAIRPGEELTYEYGREYWNDHIKPKGCRCNRCAA